MAEYLIDTHDSDETLLTRLQAGCREALSPLIRRYERELYGYLRRYLGDEDLAEDVFQTTFVQVFLKIGQYNPGRPARPWLYAIATNQAIDALRRKNRRADRRADLTATDEDGETRPFYDLLASSGDGPPEQIELAEQRALVRNAVSQLPEMLRQVILLAYFQGLKYQDIADILHIPVGTVKSRLHAAVSRFSEVWAEMNAECGANKAE